MSDLIFYATPFVVALLVAERLSFRLVARLALVLSVAAASSAQASPTEPLGHVGRWITDGDGRVVVLHGFNTVPINETLEPKQIGLTGDAIKWLSDNGFNVIR